HEVDDLDNARLCLPPGLEDERALAVAAARALLGADRCHSPMALILATEERSKRGGRVETGEAQPVDPARAGHECSCVAVANECVVLNRVGHRSILAAVAVLHLACL